MLRDHCDGGEAVMRLGMELECWDRSIVMLRQIVDIFNFIF